MNFILKFKKQFIIGLMLFIFILCLLIIYFSYHKSVIAANEISLNETDDKNKKEKDNLKGFYVDIKGEVNNPGVYLVNENNIVNDVINLANGLTENANTKCINLSKKLKEEMIIYVYNNTETKKILNENNLENSNICNEIKNNAYANINSNNSSSNENNNNNNNTSSTKKEENQIININTADQKTLTTLPGIGEAKANDIIKYRNANGGFKSIDEIKNVSGIGSSTFEKIKNLITI